MSGESVDDAGQIPALDDVLEMELDPDEDQRYIILFEEDYEDLIIDTDDSVALRLDCNQAVEILRLTSSVVADLAPDHAPDKEPIDAMIEALQEVKDGE